jgi:hypothetical protein
MRFKDSNVQKVGYGWECDFSFFLISCHMSIKLFFEAGDAKRIEKPGACWLH